MNHFEQLKSRDGITALIISKVIEIQFILNANGFEIVDILAYLHHQRQIISLSFLDFLLELKTGLYQEMQLFLVFICKLKVL